MKFDVIRLKSITEIEFCLYLLAAVLPILRKRLDFSNSGCYNVRAHGDVPKRLKGADSKSARRRKTCGGSNPSISAKMSGHQF